MKRVLTVLVVVICALVTFSTAQANLVNNGGGLIYDTDRNITWYNATAVQRNWSDSMAWAAGLTIGGVTSWRLPTALSSDGSNPDPANGYNTDSEMAHLYYSELGNVVGPGGLVNKGPFTNLLPSWYWSGTEYLPNHSIAWYFFLDLGYQNVDTKNASYYALAVHDGNVSPVPLPGALLLFGPGLVGLAAVRRRFKE